LRNREIGWTKEVNETVGGNWWNGGVADQKGCAERCGMNKWYGRGGKRVRETHRRKKNDEFCSAIFCLSQLTLAGKRLTTSWRAVE
jgi:hypothetical protein